jgi:hypothetical protein
MDQRLWTSEESATTLIGSTEPASDIRRRTITPITEPDLDIKDRPRPPDSYLCLLVECHQRSRPPITEPDLDIEADRPKTPHSYLCQLVESHERPVEPQCLAQGKNDLHESLLSLATENGAVPNSFSEKMLERLAFTISIAEGSSESLPCTEYCSLPPSPCLNPIASVHERHSTSTDGSSESPPCTNCPLLQRLPPYLDESIVSVPEGHLTFELDVLDLDCLPSLEQMATAHERQSSFELDAESLPKTEEIVPNHKGYSSSDTENFF